MKKGYALQHRLPNALERVVLILASLLGWVSFFVLFRVATTPEFLFALTLSGPSILLLTYFACGGDVPDQWRQRGCTRCMIIPIVFWASFVAAFVVNRFLSS